MSADAVILMLVAMTILWGGLVVAVVRLRRHGLPDGDELHRDL
ncbi:methionine/alanine import family NSS transporter small subunit [Nocardioides caeni]|uniref:Methionine/alanine import family NSS transporter small subunit n=1 Tax=Nocardioides caeni TaxID=574700 RepID=A0A4S8NA72_9ACTN|nr:methionine/alanine import family NSS transporter small subunit [Nocardioides caeni]THV13230.1 methionine/alanine import family NSS transporter small subunit [Nocardioides caeni]